MQNIQTDVIIEEKGYRGQSLCTEIEKEWWLSTNEELLVKLFHQCDIMTS